MPDLNHLLRAATEASRPSDLEAERVRRRFAATVDLGRAPRRQLVGRPIALGLALAVVALAATAWIVRERGRAAPLVLEFVADAGGLVTDVVATPEVTLHHAGTGRAGGTRAAPRLAWEQGRLGVEVEEHAGIDLVVTTPEAEVAVVGTVFAVERDPLGTAVDVQRGEVAVRCLADASSHRLRVGETVTCLPVGTGGLLGRARTLDARGAPLAEVLATLDLALAAGGEDAVRGEVLATRVRVLLRAGRADDALGSARLYLDEGHAARREELRALVEALAPSPGEAPR